MDDTYTRMLNDPVASAELFNTVYHELKIMAQQRVIRERGDIQATLLVHEVFLKLFGDSQPKWENRAHFFGAAAEAMRRVLVDMARARNAKKRGGDRFQVTLSESLVEAQSVGNADELLDLDRAIEQLEAEDAVLAQLVKLRFYAGQTMQDVAQILGMSLSTAERKWRLARAFLVGQMSQQT